MPTSESQKLATKNWVNKNRDHYNQYHRTKSLEYYYSNQEKLQIKRRERYLKQKENRGSS